MIIEFTKAEVTPEEYQKTLNTYKKDVTYILKEFLFFGLLLLDFKIEPCVPNNAGVACISPTTIYLPAIGSERREECEIHPGNAYWEMERYTRIALLLHEISHAAYLHFETPKDWDRSICNIAQDAVINRLLANEGTRTGFKSLVQDYPTIVNPTADGFSFAEKKFAIPNFSSLDWKGVYEHLIKDPEMQKIAEKFNQDVVYQKVDLEFIQRMQELGYKIKANAAKCAGNLPAGMEYILEQLTPPEVNWVEKFSLFLKTELARDDYMWKSSARLKHIMPVSPVLRSEALKTVVCAVDTSGSMSDEAIAEAISEIKAMRDTNPFDLVFYSCDMQVNSIERYSRYDSIDWHAVSVAGRGGTDFRPIFEQIAKEEVQPTVVVILTDLGGPFPQEEPPMPVLWVVPKSSWKDCGKPHFGEVIDIV